MHDIAFTEKAHSQEELVSISAYRLDIKPNVLSETFHDVSQVHTDVGAHK